ncbi:MAG: TetR/AcrR family transcriptional regulator [Bacillota bacterium]
MHKGESDKRTQIIKAAVKVFSEKGFHDAKVEDIAQLADVGKGTVYEYFSSKTELFQEMFRAGMQFYMENIRSEAGGIGASCRDRLMKIAEVHLQFIIDYKELAKITMSEPMQFNQDFRQWIFEERERKQKAVRAIIEEGIKTGEFAEVDPTAATLAFTGCLGGLFGPVVFKYGNTDPKAVLKPMLDVLFNGLLNRK